MIILPNKVISLIHNNLYKWFIKITKLKYFIFYYKIIYLIYVNLLILCI